MTHTTGLIQMLPDDEHRWLQGCLDATTEMLVALRDANHEELSDERYDALCVVHGNAQRLVQITDEWLIELTPF